MIDFLLPAFFLVTGLAIAVQAASLRRRRLPVPALLRVTALFSVGIGGFLFVLLVMCNP